LIYPTPCTRPVGFPNAEPYLPDVRIVILEQDTGSTHQKLRSSLFHCSDAEL